MMNNTYKNKNQNTGESARSVKFRLSAAVCLCLAVFYILALWSYSPADNTILTDGAGGTPGNWLGDAGAWISMFSFYIFGLASWVIALLLAAGAVRAFFRPRAPFLLSLAGMLAMILASSILFALTPDTFAPTTEKLGIGSSSDSKSALTGGLVGQALAAPPVESIKIYTGKNSTPKNIPVHPGFMRQWLGAVGLTLASWLLLLAGGVVLYFCQWKKIFSFAAISIALDNKLADMQKEEKEDGLAARLRNRLPEPAAAPASPSGEETPQPAAARQTFISRLLGANRLKTDTAAGNTPEAPVAAAAPQPEPVTESAPAAPEADPAIARPVYPEEIPQNAPVRSGFDRNPAAPDVSESTGGKEQSVRFFGNSYSKPNVKQLSYSPEQGDESLAAIEDAKRCIQSTLDHFLVNGSVTGHITGPQVTRFEITLAPGVSVSKITKLDADLMAALRAENIRILAPIPGRDVVGVEVPNTERKRVDIRTIFESPEWLNSKAEIPIVLGKNISGVPIVADLAKAPHLLIAGATGSGKSVCVSSILMSFFFKFNPGELSLILIDPKVVEFAFYERLPFLKTPVINEPSKALLALRWAVEEMERRYRLMAKIGSRKISEFNNRAIPPEPQLDDHGDPIPAKLELLVIVVDEFADLMMAGRDVKKDAEQAIARLAQKGRAAGVHIILATQRPSTDVITGVIKANLPTKIALRVGNRVDSQVIIGATGAQNLLGYGDMLFLPPSSPTLERIQGTFLDDNDIKRVVAFINAQAEPDFDLRVITKEDEDAEADVYSGSRKDRSCKHSDDQSDMDVDDLPEENDGVHALVIKYMKPGDDSLIRQALEIAFSERQLSTSYLQRRLGIGYNRAANIVDEFERRGIIGPARDGGNKREILVFDEILGEGR